MKMFLLMKNNLIISLAIIVFSVLATSCKEGGAANIDSLDVSFTLPASVDIIEDGECTFTVKDGKAPLSTDIIMFESVETGIFYLCNIVSVSETAFSIKVVSGLVDGDYMVYVKRGSERKPIGTVTLHLVTDIGFVPDEDSNIYGQVTCDGAGVPGVVVSDGTEVVKTDEDGFYQMRSEKRSQVVFMSVPSGYEPVTDGILPKISETVRGGVDDVEQKNFSLVKADAQQEYTLLVFGDMHLANRLSDNSDLRQFRRFAEDVNDFLAANPGRKVWALTLGDMTWDRYWIDNSYAFPEYIEDMNELFGDALKVYHTIGNHDHSMDGMGDFNKTAQYRSLVGPTYYSFNIGDYHYVVLDDIDFQGNISDRDNYVETVSSDQLAWLTKDLATVSPDTPVIIATHAPVYDDGSLDNHVRLVGSSQFLSTIEGRNVHILTGHTHRMLNVDKIGDAATGHFEHNAGAVCADWWWSYQESGVLISTDGTPGGYSIFDISGKDKKWVYKPTDFSDKYQFRSYDLNEVEIDYGYVSNADQSHKDKFAKYVAAYPASSDNEVLINIWNWDPEWTLSVTEGDNELKWTQVTAYDPLHIIAYTAKRLDKNFTATFPTQLNCHFFKVTASSPVSTLEITVTDRFGNTYKETMERPKKFGIETYLVE